MDQVMHLNGSGLPSPALILIIPPTNQILTTLSPTLSLLQKKPTASMAGASELATITTRHHESPYPHGRSMATHGFSLYQILKSLSLEPHGHTPMAEAPGSSC